MTGNRLIKVEMATEGMRPSIMPWIVELRLIIGLRKGSNFSKLLKVAILVMKVTRLERQREKRKICQQFFFSPFQYHPSFSSIYHYTADANLGDI
jgi:hypothetical protein